MPPTLERVVAATYGQVGTLRRATATFLREANSEFRDSLVLVVSELATNAIEALDDPEGEVSLRMSDLGDRVEIAVTDCGPGFGQALQRAGSDAGEPRGRGLQVVRSLVDEVSVHRHGHETTVHCVVYRF